MLVEDVFTVATPVERLWAVMQDVEQIAPCMPGAELTQVVDDRTWKGTVHVRFGPVQMSFSGTVVMEERDDEAHRARLSAKGTEHRGKGAATARVESWLVPAEGGSTAVHLRSDITITGPAAQLSRGLLPEVSKLLTKRFAECLEAKLAAGGHDSATTAPATGTPAERTTSPASRAVGALGLGVRALFGTIARFLARLFGRREGP